MQVGKNTRRIKEKIERGKREVRRKIIKLEEKINNIQKAWITRKEEVNDRAIREEDARNGE